MLRASAVLTSESGEGGGTSCDDDDGVVLAIFLNNLLHCSIDIVFNTVGMDPPKSHVRIASQY